jgi:hypothetical protein
MSYALIIPSEYLGDLVAIRTATGMSIRKQVLIAIDSWIKEKGGKPMSQIFNLVRALVCLSQATGETLESIQFLLECAWNHFDFVEGSGLWDQELCARIKRTFEKEKEGEDASEKGY